MNLSLLFKIQGVVLIVNGLGSLFLGSIWIALGTGWEATPDLITFGQFTGVVLFVVGIWSWRFMQLKCQNAFVNLSNFEVFGLTRDQFLTIFRKYPKFEKSFLRCAMPAFCL